MTKHWPERSLLAPPALSHLGEPYDHHLDFHTSPSPVPPHSGGARTSAQHWSSARQAYAAGQTRLQGPSSRSKHLTATFMDTVGPPDSTYPGLEDMDFKPDTVKKDTRCNGPEKSGKGTGKKKNYQRYPKPPYSYLAMIAMVIQRSTEKKLTLCEILKEISTLFPFFKGNYKGWRDSVRHNLSSYDCFVKVLKDPSKPQGKGNFWAVELSRIPLELLKRQNTAVSRQDETIFAQDLAPYILQGEKIESKGEPPEPVPPLPSMRPRNLSPPQDDLFRPKLDSSFAIDSLLHSFRPSSGTGEVQVTKDCWSDMERPRGSPPRPRYASSARSVSASSASPASTSSSSDDEWRGVSLTGKRAPDEAESDSYEDYKPMHKSVRRETVAPPWELPTSYAKYAPPNAVAPPSMRFNGNPLMPLHGGLPLYGYGSSPVAPGHFLGHTYWPTILPNGRVSVQAPPLIMDLDNMLQSVPPNKSVFDVLVPNNQNTHQAPSHYTLQNGPSLNRYPQY
ncbi:forkhead box protein H1 [Eucyclogobius newberryi]|uniref:forkhead box protein H1 n=1 Tax=Eucyclogobius newberryi TaxID=166745 RepID=UPI003B5C9908